MVIKNKTNKMVIAALFVALGIILPMLFHSIPNAGSIFLPMHIPILMAGLMLGWEWGLVVGIITPILSSLLTGMPPAAYLPNMIIELAVYGAVAGILVKVVKTNNNLINLYISLIGAMLAGRVAGGIVKATIFNTGEYSLAIWLTSSFVTALPGIIVQLAIIPVLINALGKVQRHSQG